MRKEAELRKQGLGDIVSDSRMGSTGMPGTTDGKGKGLGSASNISNMFVLQVDDTSPSKSLVVWGPFSQDSYNDIGGNFLDALETLQNMPGLQRRQSGMMKGINTLPMTPPALLSGNIGQDKKSDMKNVQPPVVSKSPLVTVNPTQQGLDKKVKSDPPKASVKTDPEKKKDPVKTDPTKEKDPVKTDPTEKKDAK